MDGSYHLKVTVEGDHQVVHLPPELRAPGDAVVRRDGEKLIIESARASSQKQRLLDRLATLEAIDEDFAHIQDLPPSPVRF